MKLNEITINSLFELGLTEEICTTAIIRGEIGREGCVALDSPMRPGSEAYFETVRALRMQLLRAGWKKDDRNNISSVVSPCGGHAVIVSGGNASTGIADRSPRTKRRKGEATIFAFKSNQTTMWQQLGLKEHRSQSCLMWILLSFRPKNSDLVRCELSLPAGINSDGEITDWRTRLILPTIDLGSLEGASVERDEIAHSEGREFDVDVGKRS